MFNNGGTNTIDINGSECTLVLLRLYDAIRNCRIAWIDINKPCSSTSRQCEIESLGTKASTKVVPVLKVPIMPPGPRFCTDYTVVHNETRDTSSTRYAQSNYI